jgi:threonine/homoserine/homoserine lactone efflux protein
VLEAVAAGALAGYAIAVPVGAIAVLIIETGLSHGLRAGVAAAAGAATADLAYATAAAFAGLFVTSLIAGLVVPLPIVGGAVLIGFGVRGLLALRSARESLAPMTAHEQGRRTHRRTYAAVLALTLLNPATVIYFTALTVGLPFLGGLGERLVFAAAAGLASLSWQVLLALFGAALGRGSGHRVRRVTAALGNGVIILMGALILAGPLSGG